MEKLKELKIEWLSLTDEYRENYPNGNDGSIFCDILLDKIKRIETTFRMLGISIHDYKI
jgi:hypothetical protein